MYEPYDSNHENNQNNPSNLEVHYQINPELNQPAKKPRSRLAAQITAAALAVVLVAGGAGGVVGYSLGHRAAPAADATLSVPTDTEPAATDSSTGTTASGEDAQVATLGKNDLELAPAHDQKLTPASVYSQNVDAVVAINTEGVTTNVWHQSARFAASGSGFIISADGYIVTNHHVIAKADTITVTLTSGDSYEADLVGSDEENDVALLKIDATGLPVASIGDSDSLNVGDQVAAIGNPLGELTNTLTVGYISALDREINTDGTPINMLQTDAAINSGNSGGPLFDMYGNVIGITTAKYASSSIEGLGFAIPINDAMYIIYDLMEYGYVTSRPYMGVSVRDLDSVTASYYSLPTGVYVGEVTSGGAAEKAGVQKGDIIIGLDDYEISSYTELSAALKHYHAGDTAKMTVYRAGAQVELNITFDERQPETTSTDTTEQPESDIDADVEASPFSGWTIGGETGGNGGNVH